MRYALNGSFRFMGAEYWRVDDYQRMHADESNGTYDPIAHLKQFGVAVNKHGVNSERARAMVDAMNKVSETEVNAVVLASPQPASR